MSVPKTNSIVEDNSSVDDILKSNNSVRDHEEG